MRILVVGAGGQVGGKLAAQARDAGHSVHGTYRLRPPALDGVELGVLDKTKAAEVAATVRQVAPDAVVDTGALHNVDYCEAHPDEAMAVNRDGTRLLAAAAHERKARFVFVSTDFVFDGSGHPPYRESDAPHPQSVYARSKLAGERAVLAALPEAVVVRSAWVYTGGTGKDFVAVMRRLAASDGPVDVVDDQIGSPTYVADLAAALLQVADAGVHGRVLHAANEGAVSRFEQARAVFEECGAEPQRVRPVSSAQFPRPAPRPSYSALSSRESVAAGLTPLRPWRSALVDALAATPGGTSA